MKYAIITLGGKQYKVTEDQVITIDKLDFEEGASFDAPEVLLVVDGNNRTVGAPTVDGVKVSLTVVAQEKDDKIRVATYKAKARQRRVHGHRQHISQVKVVSIK